MVKPGGEPGAPVQLREVNERNEGKLSGDRFLINT